MDSMSVSVTQTEDDWLGGNCEFSFTAENVIHDWDDGSGSQYSSASKESCNYMTLSYTEGYQHPVAKITMVING